MFLIKSDSLTFEQAAMMYSEDKDTRLNGGQVVNPRGGTRWKTDELDSRDYLILKSMKAGDISEPYEAMDTKGRPVTKVMLLKKRTNPHVANPEDDFNILKEMAAQKKQVEIVNKWVEEKIQTTFIRIEPEYRNCKFTVNGWLKS
jgi:peptidyl-prolyl cis-trans isomerase SurA